MLTPRIYPVPLAGPKVAAMGELRVVATIPTDPAAREAVRAGLAELVAATREEQGCLAYDAFESTSAPGTFVTIESWRSQEDLDAHLTMPHISKAFEILGAALTGEVAVHPLAEL
jgi:quinol monooxygenase YgiN